MNPEDLDRLHRTTIRGAEKIQSLLRRVRSSGVVLCGGINRRNETRTARIESIGIGHVVLKSTNFDQSVGDQIYINFEFDGSTFFFAASQVVPSRHSRISIETPRAIYQAERRNRHREQAKTTNGRLPAVELRLAGGMTRIGKVVDWSRYGVGIEIAANGKGISASSCFIKFLDGPRGGEISKATVCHSTNISASNSGWIRLGLSVGQLDSPKRIAVDRRDQIVAKSGSTRIRESTAFVNAALRNVPGRLPWGHGRRNHHGTSVRVEEFRNNRGNRIRAIVDSWGDPDGATTVVIPPSWGRRKETLLPLASTIKETFRRAQKPIVILRFDGTNRRGESYIDPGNRAPGDEYLGFTFSQASDDIVAALDFLEQSGKFWPSSIVLATFSLASIEGRHVLASAAGKRLSGWVSTVGMADLQSALKTISGGVDYAFGLLRGVRFGHHELVGVVADMDLTGLDAIENEMVFIEDAKREMSKIEVPVAWIHGRDDAWMNLDRVRDVLSSGDISRRRLIEVPTGHQLRTSREAMATFQLIAEEISEIALGTRLPSALPDLAELAERGAAERERRPRLSVDLRTFWGDYLLGRDRGFGMQLLTATNAYKELMSAQVTELRVKSGSRIADLGAGTGEFSSHLFSGGRAIEDCIVHEVDFISEALRRREVSGANDNAPRISNVLRVVADLDVGDGTGVPLRSRSYDSVAASLVISYLRRPQAFLREAFRILRPGGSIVVSTLRRDADISKLFIDGIDELKTSQRASLFGEGDIEKFDNLARDFLNDASRILDMEEDGRFQFWETDEFVDLIQSVGFVNVRSRSLLGHPPQAIVLSAIRPDSTESVGA